MIETQHACHRLPVYGALGFAGFSACVKSHESAAFPVLKGLIFQVPLNPTYVVKSVLCWDWGTCDESHYYERFYL